MKFTKNEMFTFFGLDCQVIEGYVTTDDVFCRDGRAIPCRWLAVRSDGKIDDLCAETGDSLIRGGIVWGDPGAGKWDRIPAPPRFYRGDTPEKRFVRGYIPAHGENDIPIFTEEQWDWGGDDDDFRFGLDALWYIQAPPDACGLWRWPKVGEERLTFRFEFERSSWESWCKKTGIPKGVISRGKLGGNIIWALPDGTFDFNAFDDDALCGVSAVSAVRSAVSILRATYAS